MRKGVIVIVLLILIGVCVRVAYRKRLAHKLNNEAVQLIDQGKYDEALRRLQQARRHDPRNPTILSNLRRTSEAL